MSNWKPVSRTAHLDKYWKPRDGYEFAATQMVVSILVIELNKLIPNFVLGFIKNADQYESIALLGLGGDRNLYVNSDGKWLGSYTPSVLRSFPFTLADQGTPEKIICIHPAHLTDEPNANKFFDAAGNLSVETQEVVDFLNNCETHQAKTRAAVKLLADAELLEAWPLKVNRDTDKEPLEINGLYRINETALNELSSESFASLRNYGALALAYAQLFSMSQLDQLASRAQHLGEQIKNEKSKTDFLFQDEGVINFDNL